METKEINELLDSITDKLQDNGVDVKGLYSHSWHLFKLHYTHCQQMRQSSCMKIQSDAIRAFQQSRIYGKQFFLIVAIDGLAIDFKRLENYKKKYSLIGNN